MNTNYGSTGYFLYVGDIQEVYNYIVPQGQTMYFMNRLQPILYIKSVNMFNQQTVMTYDLIERKQPVVAQPITQQMPDQQFAQTQTAENPSEYVTRDELTNIIAETIRNELKANRKPYNKENHT